MKFSAWTGGSASPCSRAASPPCCISWLELPGYNTLKSCKVIDYIPEWKRREEEHTKAAPPSTAVSEPSPPLQPAKESSPSPGPSPEAHPVEEIFYDVPDMKREAVAGGLGMVEITAVRDSGDEEDGSPPGR